MERKTVEGIFYAFKFVTLYRLPYNPISLDYHKSDAGKKLMKKDEKTLVRGYLRAENLD